MKKAQNPQAGGEGVPEKTEADDVQSSLILNRSKQQKSYEDVGAVFALLAERWPQTFSIFERRRRPLKVGIHSDILAVLGGVVTPAELSTALACYTANEKYLRKLCRIGAPRFDLNGAVAGKVTEDQVITAKTMLDDIRIARERREQDRKREAAEERARKYLP